MLKKVEHEKVDRHQPAHCHLLAPPQHYTTLHNTTFIMASVMIDSPPDASAEQRWTAVTRRVDSVTDSCAVVAVTRVSDDVVPSSRVSDARSALIEARRAEKEAILAIRLARKEEIQARRNEEKAIALARKEEEKARKQLIRDAELAQKQAIRDAIKEQKAIEKQLRDANRLASREIALKNHRHDLLFNKVRRSHDSVELAKIRLRQLEDRAPDSVSASTARLRLAHLREQASIALHSLALFDEGKML
jgi:hypothetical protein